VRYLIAAGTRHYRQHPALAELPLAHDDVDRIVQFLTSAEMGYARVLEAHSKDPTAADFEDALSEWCLGAELTADDVVTVYSRGTAMSRRQVAVIGLLAPTVGRAMPARGCHWKT
jgi:head-tail adaptor